MVSILFANLLKEATMALPGETGHIGKKCMDCGRTLFAQVCMSGAGYYIGTMCCYGPYSRESIYYPTREIAQEHLDNDTWIRR